MPTTADVINALLDPAMLGPCLHIVIEVTMTKDDSLRWW